MSKDESKQPQRARVLWQHRFEAPIGRAPLALADGVLVPLRRGARTTVCRIDLEDGDIRWETVFDGPAAAAIARTGRVLAVPLTSGRLVGLDIEDGSPWPVPWKPVMGEFSDPVFARDQTVFLRLMPGTGSRIAAFRVGESGALWQTDDPTTSASDATFAVSDGVLVMAGTNGDDKITVAGINRRDGTVVWTNDQGEGRLNDLWAVAGLIDLVTDADGVFGLDAATGRTRNQRFSDFPFQRAMTVGESLLMVTQAKGDRVLFCFNSVGEQITGRVRDPLERVIGASLSEVLVGRPDGTPALYTLPELEPVDFPEAAVIGPTLRATFSRDVAYLVSEDLHTMTAVDLDAS